MALTIADQAVAAGDLDEAVARGILTPAQRDAVTAIARARRQYASVPDDEQFRLLTGFNDIFVTLAIIVLLVGVGGILGSLLDTAGARGPMPLMAVAPAAVAGVSWLLAGYFTRVRRMALPSIVLLAAFVGGIFGTVVLAFSTFAGGGNTDVAGGVIAAAGLAAAAEAWLHWRRFAVPITVAAGAGAVVALLFGVARQLTPGSDALWLWLAGVAGVGVFLLAMRFDITDPRRETRRTDVAFWLHLLAAPLIVHPLMSGLGLFGAEPAPSLAGAVIALYAVFTLVALVIDRRALLVSALGYVIYAIFALLKSGANDLRFPLTALVIGLFLVSLSALWRQARAAVVGWLPTDWSTCLPVTAH